MAKRRKTKGKKHRLPDPEDVLAGRVEIRVEALFDLIHRVNPTGRELAGREQARRYAQKTRLQSLLVRRFGDDHLDVQAGDHEGIVSLLHRSGARDGCHAMLAELPPDARAWIRRRLDAALAGGDDIPAGERRSTDEPAATDAEPATGDLQELLRTARRALADFDYESAERHLELAFAHSHGVRAALALLELRVDTLGMDAKALELEPHLSAAARADPEVRTLLALAAARLGDSDRAAALVRGTLRPRTAEVYVALASQAIRRRDREEAERCLRAVAERVPTHPQIPQLAEEIGELGATEQRRAEAVLEQRYQQRGCLEMEEEARAFADRWPGSEVARRILSAVAAQRHEIAIAEHLEHAAAALAEERFGTAARQLQAALDAGCAQPDLPARIEAARARQRQRRERVRVEGALGRFAAGDPPAALLAYLALPDELRGRVRQQVTEPTLAWLDELDPPRSGARAKAAVTAVLALARAVAALRRGQAQAALDELQPHAGILDAVGEGHRCLEDAATRVAAEHHRRAGAALDTAWEVYTEGRIGDARRLYGTLEISELDDRDRRRAVNLRDCLRHAETMRSLAREHERQRAAGDLLGARQLARQLACKAEVASERRQWQARWAELGRRIRAAWRLETADTPIPLAELGDFWTSPFGDERPRIWLDDTGRELMLANAWGTWLFLRLVDLERRAIVERVSMRTPEPLREPVAVCRDGDRLWVAGAGGGVVELARSDWDVLAWHPLRDMLPREMLPEMTTPLPGGSYLWLQGTESQTRQTHVFDLEARRLCRSLAGSMGWVIPIVGPGEPRVVHTGMELATRLYTARGTPAGLETLPKKPVQAAAIAPDGGGLVVAVDEIPPENAAEPWAEDGLEEDPGILLAPLGDGGIEPAAGILLAEAASAGVHPLATSLAQGLTFVLAQSQGRTRHLLCLRFGEVAEQLYRVQVPFDTVLVQDRWSRHAVALSVEAGSVAAWSLSAQRPSVGPVAVAPLSASRIYLHLDLPPALCGKPTAATNATVLALTALLGRWPEREIAQRLAELTRQRAGDVEYLVCVCYALERLGIDAQPRRALVGNLAESHPYHGGAALLAAVLAAEEGRWEEVRRLLDSVDPGNTADFDDGRKQHFHHLHGLALFQGGQPLQALAAFEKGAAVEDGDCQLEPLLQLTRPMADPPEPEEWGPGQPPIRQLMGATRVADRALASGDAAAARAALERPVVWEEVEKQSAARLAAAYLETTAATAEERFCKRHALAFFRQVLSLESPFKKPIFFPGPKWERARLTELDERARAWLEEPEDADGALTAEGSGAASAARPAG